MKDLKNYLMINSTFFAKKISLDSPLNTLLDSALDNYTISKKDLNTPAILWPATRYNLEKSSIFESLNLDIKNKILERITQLNLSLSYYIEKSGHNYGAKMILMSETIQEKSTYALFAAEEAIHLREFENFMNFTPDPKTHWHPMLEPLANVIHEGEKNTCLYIIQVLLEGFGMGHYNSLKKDCLYPPLVAVYDRILKDEARHHGAGLILAKESTLTQLEEEQIFEYTRQFILALQSANWVFKLVEEFSSPLSKEQAQTFYKETQYQDTVNIRLQALKQMLLKARRDNLVSQLEKEGVFNFRV